ncbi:MAG: hypothetical protein WA160_00485 [Pseudobdellovibrio sp.]
MFYMQYTFYKLFSTLSIVCIFFTACDRAAESNSKISIQIPVNSNSIAKKTDVTTLAEWSSNVPSDINSFNCYMIAVTGPEDYLKRNICSKKSTGVTSFYAGPVVGAVFEGGSLEVDVTPGKDRVVYLIGFQATTSAACQNYKSTAFDQSNLSKPYIIGKTANLNLAPNTVSNVPISMVFDSNNWFDDCQGPEFNDSNKNKIATKASLRKYSFPEGGSVYGTCNSIDVELKDDNFNNATSDSNVSFGVDAFVNASPSPTVVTTYDTFSNCTATSGGVNNFSIAAGSSTMKRWYASDAILNNNIGAALALKLNFSQTTLVADSNGSIINLNTNSSSYSALNFSGPQMVIPDVCYKYEVASKYYNLGINAGDATAYYIAAPPESKLFSDATCLSSITAGSTNPNGSINYTQNFVAGFSTIYIKYMIPLSDAARNQSFELSHSGYLGKHSNAQISVTTNIAKRLVIRENAILPNVMSTCYGPFYLALVNDYGAEIKATSARNINVSGLFPIGITFHEDSCGGTLITGMTTIPSGESSRKIYIQFGSTPEAGDHTKTFTDSSDPSFSFLFKYRVD